MAGINNRIEKLGFLIGNWEMEYNIPKSPFSDVDKGTGTGEFKKILNDSYVTFDYSATLTKGKTKAHGIFARDEKGDLYRYWWFEDTGNFMSADCNLLNNSTLFMNWHDSLLIQTFTKIDTNKMILQMKHPASNGE